jgi:hypothetical protein
MVFFYSQVSKEVMNDKFVEIHLAVNQVEGVLIANMKFLNSSKSEIYLDTQTICFDNKTRRNVFNIIDEDNNKIGYKGAFVYREVVPQDYIKLKGGEVIESTIPLDGIYEFSKGHKYSIQYSVFHPTYKDESGFTLFESNKVEVIY